MSEPLLLPSQEALVERLSHNIYYAEQLQLLCGENGSGKTYLLKHLNRHVEDVLVVLLSCPLHADDAEIRRKILLPLLSDPVFDDEISLADSISNLASSFSQSILILIDDAERLSTEVWAELIALSQMSVADRLVSIVASVTPEFEKNIFDSLPDSYHSMMSSLYIESLIQQEQDTLYYSLLSQSDGFENHLMAKPNFNRGKIVPKDIVAFFVQSNDQNIAPIKKVNKVYWSVTVTIAAATLAIGWLYHVDLLSLYIQNDEKVQQSDILKRQNADLPAIEPLQSNQPTDEPTERLSVDEQQLLLPAKQKHFLVSDVEVNKEKTVKSESSSMLLDDNAQGDLPIKVNDSVVSKPINQIEPDVKKMVETAQTVIESEPIADRQEKLAEITPKPEYYTLQIATVSKQKSLDNLLNQLKHHQDVRVGLHKSRWVVFVGEFDSYQSAKNYERILATETELPKPWLRKWKALKNVELQNPQNNSEN